MGTRKKRSARAAPKRASARSVAQPPGSDLQLVYSENQVQKRIREIASQVNRDYQGKTLHVVGILENCFVFMADLVRHIKVPTICHFIKAEMKDREAGQVTVREIMYTPRVDAANKDILLVEGILQSGVTLDHLYRFMLGQGASSVRTATLVEKTDERKVDVATDYVAFKSEEKYLVGYGLGFQDKYRNLPCIASMAGAQPQVAGSH